MSGHGLDIAIILGILFLASTLGVLFLQQAAIRARRHEQMMYEHHRTMDQAVAERMLSSAMNFMNITWAQYAESSKELVKTAIEEVERAMKSAQALGRMAAESCDHHLLDEGDLQVLPEEEDEEDRYPPPAHEEDLPQ